MAINYSAPDREYKKFVESPTRPNETAIEVYVGNPGDISSGGALASTPVIYNVSAPTASTEVSQALTSGVKKFLIRVRGNANLQLAYIATESATNYITIPAGSSMFIDGLNASSLTLYFQTDKSSQTIEIQEWT